MFPMQLSFVFNASAAPQLPEKTNEVRGTADGVLLDISEIYKKKWNYIGEGSWLSNYRKMFSNCRNTRHMRLAYSRVFLQLLNFNICAVYPEHKFCPIKKYYSYNVLISGSIDIEITTS
jgi:hypothetical protein